MGYEVRVLAHSRKKFLPCEGVEVFEGDITRPETIVGLCQGAHAVIHLVGIISERGRSTFEKIHVEGTRNILAETRRTGVKRFLHMSAAGARPNAASLYHQTKWDAEELVRASQLEWTILRPSLIYGARGEFVQMILGMTRFPQRWLLAGIIPCIGGESILKPIPVEEVARAFVRAMGNERSVGKTLELGGPETTVRKIFMEVISANGGKPSFIDLPPDRALLTLPWHFFRKPRPLLVPIPGTLARVMTDCMEWADSFLRMILPQGLERHLPAPPLNSSMVIMLEENQIADSSGTNELLDLHPPTFAAGIQRSLVIGETLGS